VCNWVPQLDKPQEIAVVPPKYDEFRIPAGGSREGVEAICPWMDGEAAKKGSR